MIILKNPPSIVAAAAVGGKKEGLGPYGKAFDHIFEDEMMGQKSWEFAEVEFQLAAVERLFGKTELRPDILIGGDLQSQCTASSSAALRLQLPFFGVYGACSTISQSLGLAACLVSSGQSSCSLCITSSHYCSAERQFRTPLDYGSKRSSTAQWTVTAAAGIFVAPAKAPPYITRVMFGRVTDLAITDPSNMGAAMAPAALDTLIRFFKATVSRPEDYSAIYTGDLGLHGSSLFLQLAKREGLDINNHLDCGSLIFSSDQEVECGGSGCGCGASMLGIKVIPDLLKTGGRVLFMATGALLSPVTVGQAKNIPGIAHLIEITA